MLKTYSCPLISGHGFDRAEERLGMDPGAFESWVEATYVDWMPMNPEFFYSKNIKCAAANGDTLFYTPWTLNRGLCIVVSKDHCIKTVIDFEDMIKI